MSESKRKKRKYKTKTSKSNYDIEWNSFLTNMLYVYGRDEVRFFLDDDVLKNEYIKVLQRDEASKLVKVGYLYTDYLFAKKNRKYDSKELNDMLRDIGYEIIEDVSIPEIMVFYNKDKNIYSIVHRGTQIQSQTGIMDIMSDLTLFMNKNSKRIEERVKETTDIIDYIKSNETPNQDAHINLIGHSLGSFSSSLSFLDPYNLKNINSLTTFSGAFFDSPILKEKLSKLSSDDINELNRKSTHHRMEGDIVSLGSLKSLPFGELFSYQLTKGYYEKRPEDYELLNVKDTEKMIDADVIKNRKSHLYAHRVDRFFRSDLNPMNELSAEADYIQDLLDVNAEFIKKHPSMKNINYPMRKQEENKKYFEDRRKKGIKPTQPPPYDELMEELTTNINKIFGNQENPEKTFEEKITEVENKIIKEIQENQINNNFEKVFEYNKDESLPFNKSQPLNIDPFSLCKIDPTLEGCENFI